MKLSPALEKEQMWDKWIFFSWEINHKEMNKDI